MSLKPHIWLQEGIWWCAVIMHPPDRRRLRGPHGYGVNPRDAYCTWRVSRRLT